MAILDTVWKRKFLWEDLWRLLGAEGRSSEMRLVKKISIGLGIWKKLMWIEIEIRVIVAT